MRLSNLGAALLFLAAALPALAQGPAGGPPPAVTTAQPVVREVTEWDEYTGRFEAVDAVDLRARVSGFLVRAAFNEGQLVKKGAVLFEIDPRPFQRTLEARRAELQSARVRAEFTAKDVERARPLLKNATISEQVFDQRQQAQREAEAAVLGAEAAAAAAELDLEFTQITAPVDGRIGARLVSAGNYVTGASSSGTLLARIVSQDPIYFSFDVSQTDHLKYQRLAREGSRPSSQNSANPVSLALQDEEKFPHQGKMNFVDNRIDDATGTVRGRAVFDNPQNIFTPGLFARIRLIGSGTYKGIMLPDEAIGTDQSNRFVYAVAEDGAVVYKRVALGPLIDGLRIVRSGVDPADWVIVKGIQRARQGGKVTATRGTIEAPEKAASLP